MAVDGSVCFAVRRSVLYVPAATDLATKNHRSARRPRGRLWMSMRSDESGCVCLLDSAPTSVTKFTDKRRARSNWFAVCSKRRRQLWRHRFGSVPLAGIFASVCKTYTRKHFGGDSSRLAEDKEEFMDGFFLRSNKIAVRFNDLQ